MQKTEEGKKENNEKKETFLIKIFPLSTFKHLSQQFESEGINTDGRSVPSLLAWFSRSGLLLRQVRNEM